VQEKEESKVVTKQLFVSSYDQRFTKLKPKYFVYANHRLIMFKVVLPSNFFSAKTMMKSEVLSTSKIAA